ncbi:hypothetical protein ABK040_014236 [Willaertia magna]
MKKRGNNLMTNVGSSSTISSLSDKSNIELINRPQRAFSKSETIHLINNNHFHSEHHQDNEHNLDHPLIQVEQVVVEEEEEEKEPFYQQQSKRIVGTTSPTSSYGATDNNDPTIISTSPSHSINNNNNNPNSFQPSSSSSFKASSFQASSSSYKKEVLSRSDFKDFFGGKKEKYFIFFNLEKEERYLFETATSLIHFLKKVYKNCKNIWIDCQNVDIKDMLELQKFFKFHEITIEDCTNHFDQTEKWEYFEHYFYCVISSLESTTQLEDSTATSSSIINHNNNHNNSNDNLQSLPYIGLKDKTKNTTTNNNNNIKKQQLEKPIFINILLLSNCILTIHEKTFQGQDLMIQRIENDLYKKFSHQINANINNNNLMESTSLTNNYSSTTSLNSLNTISDSSSSTFENNPLIWTSPFINKNNKINNKINKNNENNKINNLKRSRNTLTLNTSYIFYLFFDCIVDKFMSHLDSSILRKINQLDEMSMSTVNHLKKSQNPIQQFLNQIGFFKKQINLHKKFIKQKHEMLTLLITPSNNNLYNIIFYLRDVLDHLNFCNERLEMSNDALHECHFNYLTKLQIDIANISFKRDNAFDRISTLAILYAPLTLIGGIWGMNCYVPGQGQDDLFWFFGLCLFMVIVVLIILMLLRKNMI